MISICGKENILVRASNFLTDESRYTLGIPSAIYYPEKEDELQSLIIKLYKDKKVITLSGAKTGITGGAVPQEDSVVISFLKMNRIISVIKKNHHLLLECEPGITLTEIDLFLKNPAKLNYDIKGIENLEENRWFYSPDPTEMSAQLGGTIATNASGARSFKYGATRDSIFGLSIILANGEKVDLKRSQPSKGNENLSIITTLGNKITLKKSNYKSDDRNFVL